MSEKFFTSFVEGHAPKEEEIQYTLGSYQIIRSIGKGGMGEVLLAYDKECGRKVALKKIREDLIDHKIIHNRFLKEARITSQLPHPFIMPIYSIEDRNEIAYYTMPFVQGETLKQILRTTREQEKLGKELHHIGGSIPALIRILISVCQAVAFAHSKGVLHRDLKPENIMIGAYGEILILDWGLAKLINSVDTPDEILELKTKKSFRELTRPGKVVGTVSFMAPERALGNPATIQTEIYALGVTLYQILTLRNPFRRGPLEQFRKTMDQEFLEEATDAAPYRDVPPVLSRIATKCLSKNPQDRYSNVNELLRDLENYIEGRSEWFQIAKLDILNKDDWEFQENVLIAEHMAITRGMESADWVSLMISKASFSENTMISAKVKIGDKGYGIGFLMSLPEAAERTHLNDGYCLWLGSDINKSTKLLRSTVEVITAPDIFLNREQTYDIRIEKIEHNIYFYLNDVKQFSYISHLPLVGTHFGILAKDADFTIEECIIYIGSQNITVNCLSVPDALLAHKNYASALHEYRRLGYSFPGRAEGREAMFRAGITILEEAKSSISLKKKEKLYDEALVEFEKLHATPGAPLEYLGKAHVYQAMQDLEEEVKCYELGFRKYLNHPLLPILHEKLIYRMHETSRTDRKATYLFMQTALSHLPYAIEGGYTKRIFESLEKHWEPLYFIDQGEGIQEASFKKQLFRIQLAFWLANPAALAEIINELIEIQPHPIFLLANALFCLIEIGDIKLAKKKLTKLPLDTHPLKEMKLLELLMLSHEESSLDAAKSFFETISFEATKGEIRALLHFMEQSIKMKESYTIPYIISHLARYELSQEIIQKFDCLQIWMYLLENKWEDAGRLIQKYPLTLLTKDNSPLFILYGCWLGATENSEIALIHFSGSLDISYPRTINLLGHFLTGKITLENKWGEGAFSYEKRQLFRQLELFYHCIGNEELENHFHSLEDQEYNTLNY